MIQKVHSFLVEPKHLHGIEETFLEAWSNDFDSHLPSVLLILEPVLNGHASPKTVSMLREQQFPQNVSNFNPNPNSLIPVTSESSEVSLEGIEPTAVTSSLNCDVEAQTENPPLGIVSTSAAAAVASLHPGAAAGTSPVDSLLKRIFRFPYAERVSITPPGRVLRRRYLESALLDWLNGNLHELEGFDIEAAAKLLPKP